MGGSSSSNRRLAHPDGKTMKAIVFAKHGKHQDVLALTDVPLPSGITENQVMIKVAAASINPIDKMRVEGDLKALRPEAVSPTVLGYDAAGVIDAVGSGVTEFKVGDEVYVRLVEATSGSLAEYCVSDQTLVAMKPSKCTMEEAAAMPLACVTALQGLRRIGLKEGDKVFISGGAGGVGSFAIQLAKHIFQASVVATTASPGAKTELCKSLGADIVINYKEQKFETELKDYDCCFDTTHESAKMPEICKKGGKVTTVSDTPTVDELVRIGVPLSFPVKTFLNMKKNKAAIASAATHGVEWTYMFLQPNGKDLKLLASYVDDSKLKVVLDGTWEMSDWRAFVDRHFSGRAGGKCVLRIPGIPSNAEVKDSEAKAVE